MLLRLHRSMCAAAARAVQIRDAMKLRHVHRCHGCHDHRDQYCTHFRNSCGTLLVRKVFVGVLSMLPTRRKTRGLEAESCWWTFLLSHYMLLPVYFAESRRKVSTSAGPVAVRDVAKQEPAPQAWRAWPESESVFGSSLFWPCPWNAWICCSFVPKPSRVGQETLPLGRLECCSLRLGPHQWRPHIGLDDFGKRRDLWLMALACSLI